MREMRDRMRLTRTVAGTHFTLDPNGEPLRVSSCCGCGGLAVRALSPSRALRASWGQPPHVYLALCEACDATARRHTRFEWTVALAGAACAALSCTLAFLLAPWSAWPWLSVASALGCVTALLARLLRAPAFIGNTGWKGVPARWEARIGDRWVLATPSPVIRAALQAEQQESAVTERDGRALLLALVLSVCVAPVAWRSLHPEVRIINLGPRLVRVFIDGRSLGVLPPTWSEAPNIGIVIRVPVGNRAFEARDEAGARVDFVRAWLAHDVPVVYAPAHAPFCLWVEQRSYGATPAAGPSVLKLPPDETLLRLPFDLDAWFQPNPAGISRDRWFSGGLRRTLRFGPCSPAASP
jgi:hypothetical protein